MSEISEAEIKSMTKEQNYIRGYKDGKSDVLDKIKDDIEQDAFSNLNGSKYISVNRVNQFIDKYSTERNDKS